MTDQLPRIYTRTGDDGTTGLISGVRVDKDSIRIEALGTLDELNSAIGVVSSCGIPDEFNQLLADIQRQLFDIGAELAVPAQESLTAERVTQLEHRIDALNTFLPPLRQFILPGGAPAVAHCHQARSVCRRAERRVLQLSRTEPVNENTLKYLNRLSDLLFVVARTLARTEGGKEVYWHFVEQQKP